MPTVPLPIDAVQDDTLTLAAARGMQILGYYAGANDGTDDPDRALVAISAVADILAAVEVWLHDGAASRSPHSVASLARARFDGLDDALADAAVAAAERRQEGD